MSETYTGAPVSLPVRVVRSQEPGPAVFLTGAVHGNELNGTGIIRSLMLDDLELTSGTVIFVPVANIFGFESHSRYLPDRRDLNRNFPGDPSGTLALRLAHSLFTEVIRRCDYGIDLHTAATRRSNFPHIRADLSRPEVAEIARVFGSELIVNNLGDSQSLRRTACEAGCPTILLEAGEALKFEPGIIELGVRGVKNVLKALGMLDGPRVRPTYQTAVQKTRWVRAKVGGIVRFHVAPGDVVDKGDALATCDRLFADDGDVVYAPVGGIIIGMTTLPAVKPGEPICHLAIPEMSLAEIRERAEAAPRTLHRRVQADLATGVAVVEPEDEA